MKKSKHHFFSLLWNDLVFFISSIAELITIFVIPHLDDKLLKLNEYVCTSSSLMAISLRYLLYISLTFRIVTSYFYAFARSSIFSLIINFRAKHRSQDDRSNISSFESNDLQTLWVNEMLVRLN